MISVQGTDDIPSGYDICFADNIRFAYGYPLQFHKVGKKREDFSQKLWYNATVEKSERRMHLEETVENPSSREVLQELRSIGLCRATDCLQIVNGRVELRPEILEGEKGAGILALECTDKGWKVKFCDKLKALEMLGEHLGLFREHSSREREDCNLLEAILDATKEDLPGDDISDLQ